MENSDEKTAEYYKSLIVKTVNLYDMPDHMAYMTEAGFYANYKDEKNTLKSIRNAIESLPKMRKTYDSVLSKHIYKDFCMDDKKEKEFSDMIKQLKKTIVNALKDDEKFFFINDNEEFKKLVKENED